MAIQKTEAIVLRTQPFRSSSLIVTFFTKSFGKLKGIAKGVRREREMRGALYELFTHLEIVFYEKTRSDLHLISEAAIMDSHDALRTKLDTVAYASYFSEMVDRLTEVHDHHDGIFELLDFTFRFLSSVPAEKLARLFEVKLLREIGWLPLLDGCFQCQTSAFEKGFFSIRQGAIFCPNCAREFPDAKPMSPEALSVFRYYADHPLELALKQRMSPSASAELGRVIDHFLQYRLSFPLNSRRFLESIATVLHPSR
ncbi:MAG: DNA repair protein RecO [Candidatus Omnitrophica bacterium]|nr:DNA repair protein RecO [Candidatus Omnitrophota bacterium]MDD5671351.1 DNA repair protein RecO [Candidatus Omnitrophota bacterium]